MTRRNVNCALTTTKVLSLMHADRDSYSDSNHLTCSLGFFSGEIKLCGKYVSEV